MEEQPQEKELYCSHPAMFRNRPFSYILCALLVPVVIGAVILLIWWWRTRGVTFIVTDRRTILRTGVFSKHLNEVLHAHVRSLQVDQSFFQRLFNVGTISISSAGQAGIEILMPGIPDPEGVRALIDRYRFADKEGRTD